MGFWAAFFLAILPRYIAYLHNNIKDVPLAVLFTLAIYLFAKVLVSSFWLACTERSECVQNPSKKDSGVLTSFVPRMTTMILIVIFLGHFLYVEKNYFPYEGSYFNFLVGGLHGAEQQLFDADLWANPVKEAALWVNKNAAKNSTVNVPLAGNIADLYLRKDLKRLNGREEIFQSDYVILDNRPSVFWLNNNIYSFMYSHQPIYTIKRDNTPLLFIYGP